MPHRTQNRCDWAHLEHFPQEFSNDAGDLTINSHDMSNGPFGGAGLSGASDYDPEAGPPLPPPPDVQVQYSENIQSGEGEDGLSAVAVLENIFDEQQTEVINGAVEAIVKMKDTDWINAFTLDIDNLSQRFPNIKGCIRHAVEGN